MFYLVQAMMFVIVLSLIPLIIKKWEVFKRIANSAPVFIIITILVALSNNVFTFFDNDIIVLLELLTRLGISFILPFVFVNLEYNIVAIQKFQLKDTYSHDLGQLLQKVSAITYLIESGQELETNFEEINQSMENIGELLELIREL